MAGPYAPPDSRNYVGIGKEVTRGTGVAPTFFGAYLGGVDLNHGQAVALIKEAGAAGQVTTSEKTGHMPGGAFGLFARPSSSGRLAAYQMGQDTIGAPVLGVTPHTIVSDFVTDYLSIEQNLADEGIERFIDSVIAEIVWSCDRDNPRLRARCSWLGGAPAFQAAATAESYEAEDPWVLSEAAFTVDADATPDNPVFGFTITERILYGVEKIAKVTPEYMVKVGEELELEVSELLLGVNTGYREIHYGSLTGTAAQATAKTGAFIANFTRGAAGTARRLQLNVPLVHYQDGVYTPLDPDGSEGTKLTRTAAGVKASGSPLLEVKADNLDAAAYV